MRKRYFQKRNSFLFPLFIALFSILLVYVQDIYSKKFSNEFFQEIRGLFDNVISPFYNTVKNTKMFFESTYDLIIEKKNLIHENRTLKKKFLLSQVEILSSRFLRKENDKLRGLLRISSLSNRYQTTVAKVILNIRTPQINQIVFDKGENDGIKIGQIVLEENGVVGQVVSVGKWFSRASSIYDFSNAIPVICERNGIRMVVLGNGYNNDLKLDYFSENYEDFRPGDILVTSGLGGKFPKGYPVAITSFFKYNQFLSKVEYFAKPIINLKKIDFIVIK
ncbi:rod shape-determining protein MreC [Candidatus Riesia pediculicola]|uniref:rod shape-determining protein MreC n=1 Tax=Candidatus Riesia pediculicola TaxID=401619 RepID=UPI0009C3A63B|nr:rod shape-determining protein MreC [Candidatus Riesia pediculicola]ARC54035.1 hypothetical protein AOE57_00065 [Candidatus Riesia pediculicola]